MNLIKLPSKITHTGITGTWDGARKWATAAAMAEKLKLFCQVMTGFELITIKKQAGIQQGGDQKSADAKSKSHRGILISGEEIEKQLGVSHSVAGRWEQMAAACAKRLKKLPELQDFDPAAASLADLPKDKQEALNKAVAKLTDGLTQKEFGESLGLWKKPQGAGATGRAPGEGGRKKLTLAEQAEALQQLAVEDWQKLELAFTAYGTKFTVLSDLHAEAQIAVLEKQLTARKAWLKQPLNNRDPKAVEALL